MNGAQARGVRSIAVLRANALGDLLFTLPALTALRNTFPRASIVVLGRELHREFLRGRREFADHVDVVPAVQGVTVPPSDVDEPDDPAKTQWLEAQRHKGYDIAIQLHGGGRYSNPLVTGLGAKLTVGLQDFDAPPLDVNVPYVYYQNETLRGLEVVATLGAAASPSPQLTALPDEREEGAAAIGDTSHPVAVIHPGATDLRRRWPVERFAAVAEEIWQRGFLPVVTGSSEEQDIADLVCDMAQCPTRNIAGKVSLGGLVGVLERAALMVGNDTGPLHVATALGTPTVGLFWCVNEINSGFPWRMNHRPVISWTTRCPVCYQTSMPVSPGGDRLSRCEHDTSLLHDISVDAVLKTIDSLQATTAFVGAGCDL